MALTRPVTWGCCLTSQSLGASPPAYRRGMIIGPAPSGSCENQDGKRNVSISSLFASFLSASSLV